LAKTAQNRVFPNRIAILLGPYEKRKRTPGYFTKEYLCVEGS
jgi:hypothetical protein